jgi:hypothetical protein
MRPKKTVDMAEFGKDVALCKFNGASLTSVHLFGFLIVFRIEIRVLIGIGKVSMFNSLSGKRYED